LSTDDVLTEERKLARWNLEDFESPLQCSPDRPRARGHESLHENHQEADGGSLLLERLVISLTNILGDGLVEGTLFCMGCAPCNGNELRTPGLEERLSLIVDRPPLLRANDVRRDTFLTDGFLVRKRIRIKEGNQPPEGVCLALMRGRREQQ